MGSANRLIAKYRGWEYWNTYLFEFPLYILGLFKLALKGMGIRDLCRCNSALDHGGFVFASKFEIQKLFNPVYFPKTILIEGKIELSVLLERIKSWMLEEELQYPIILKPDNGRIGKAVVRASNDLQLKKILQVIEGRYLVQEYCHLPFEVGLFFFRKGGKAGIFSLNSKEFPHVFGDGRLNIQQLIAIDSRLQRFTEKLSKQVDLNSIPAAGEIVNLSYVGNHAQGAVFHSLELADSTKVLQRIEEVVGKVSGFNYGRLDVRAMSLEAFERGDFQVLEVNGVDSLSTNIFDPSWSVLDAYCQLYKQYSLLIDLAYENKNQPMQFYSWREIISRTLAVEKELERNHTNVLTLGLR